MSLKLLSLAIGAVLVSANAAAATDCSRAKTNVDKLICSSSALAVAQEHMAWSFRQAVWRGVDPGKLRSSQLQWKAEVRDVCNDVPCLLKAFDERGAQLDNY
jgi:uncharacterized protein